MSLKANFVCGICTKILKNPISVPCNCSQICKEHVDYEIKNKKTSMTCATCKESYDIPENGFLEMKKIKDSIEKNYHLSEDEKQSFDYLNRNLNEIANLYTIQFQAKLTELPTKISDHFEDMRRKVDIRRETLIEKIHKISAEMIKKIEECEANFKSIIRDDLRLNIKKESKNLIETFRDPNLSLSTIESLKEDFNRKENQLGAKLNEMELINDEMSNLGFEAGCDIDIDLFGDLDLIGSYKKLISTAGNTINVYNICKDSSLESLSHNKLSHENMVTALQIYQKNKLISASNDTTIKVWDLKTFKCITTLTGHTGGIESLKLLKHDLLSSGSGDNSIRLWDISANGMFSFISSLKGHTGSVLCLEQLQNEHLISGSADNSIKQWNLSNSTCVNTFSFHKEPVRCLKVLSHKTFASGSGDRSIKIINFISGKCMHVLNGHINYVMSLEIFPRTEDCHRLISCSNDGNIILWNLDNGEQIKVLKGHTSNVTCIKLNKNGKTLISGSYDKNFKVWDLEIGNCLKTITCANPIWKFILC